MNVLAPTAAAPFAVPFLQLVAYRIDELSPLAFRQSRVPLRFDRQPWSAARHHHLDAQQVCEWSVHMCVCVDWCGLVPPLAPVSASAHPAAAVGPPVLPRCPPISTCPQLPDGSWLAVADGDRQSSAPISSRLIRE